MNIQNSKTLLVLAAALSLTTIANAQIKSLKDESAPSPASMVGLPGTSRFGTDPLHLLQTAKVKKELKITDDQSAKLAKVAGKYAEQQKVAVRNVRRDANDDLKKAEKDGVINQDEQKRMEAEVQKFTDEAIKRVDEALKTKEQEIMHV